MENALRIGLNICYAVCIIGGILYIPRLFFNFYGLVKQKPLKQAKEKGNFAILIPARNESRVIEDLLIALKNQNYPADKIHAFIMVTDEKDKTIEIAQKYSFVEDVLVVPKNLNSKGKTMDICIKKLLKENKKFDAYFIFDADNVPEENYLSKMNDVYQAGYEIGMGRRVNKQQKGNWVSINSFLTFSYINSMNNKFRTRLKGAITISGSGLFVSGRLIEKWGGFPFQTLTEDYELSRYALVNNIKSYYNETATFKDEQPISFKQSNRQRLRWIKGHNIVDKKYNKFLFREVFSFKTPFWFIKFDYLFNLVPIILILVGLIIFFLYAFGFVIAGLIAGNIVWKVALQYAIKTFIVLYGILAIYALVGLICDRDIIKCGFFRWLGAFLMSPLYLMSWGFLYLAALVSKNAKWAETKHGNDKK